MSATRKVKGDRFLDLFLTLRAFFDFLENVCHLFAPGWHYLVDAYENH
jgi:hypothetical protein